MLTTTFIIRLWIKLILEKECGKNEKNISISNASNANPGAEFPKARAKLK